MSKKAGITSYSVNSKPTLANFFLKNFFVLAFLLAISILGVMVWYTWYSYDYSVNHKNQNISMTELRGDIKYCDEALTMSAFMAAATGDSKWETRYRRFEKQLDSSIKKAKKLIPDEFIGQAVKEIDAANATLVAMENEVFKRVRQGEQSKALEILNSVEYKKQKGAYSEGMDKVNQTITQRIKSQNRNGHIAAMLTTAVLIVVVATVMLVWICVQKTLQKYIEQRDKAEIIMREWIERFDLASKGTDDGIWDWNIPTNAMYQSPRFKELIGYQEREIQSSYKNWESRLHAEDYDRVMHALKEHLEKRVPFRLDYRLRTRTGYKWFKGTGQAVWDEKGNAVRMVGAIHDITDRKEIELSLRKSEERYRSIFDATASLIVSVDREGIIVDCNERIKDLLGYKKSEVMGQSVTRIIHPDYFATAQKHLNEVLTKGFLYNYECRMVHKDGAKVDVMINSTALKGEDGQCNLIVCIVVEKYDSVHTNKSAEKPQAYCK
jgi:PAS domain S-box-containing protein